MEEGQVRDFFESYFLVVEDGKEILAFLAIMLHVEGELDEIISKIGSEFFHG